MKALLSVLLFTTACSLTGLAQVSIDQQVVGTSGNFSTTDNNSSVSSTVGEPIIQTLSDGSLTLTQGFQQPQWVIIEELNLKYYTGITPNGDGLNDIWFVDGIDQYPENDIKIFGRSGTEVWSGENYDNVTVYFEGRNKSGAELTMGTYFFIMNIPGMETQKGWIDISK